MNLCHQDQAKLCNNISEVGDEELSAVASAEEYATKIIRLQQACLTPLKEDLADWLNKIMNISSVTIENFMDKLDNGVIICRLAKIISLWCQQQLSATPDNTHDESNPNSSKLFSSALNIASQSTNCLISSSMTSLYHGCNGIIGNQFVNNLIRMEQTKIWEDAKCRTFYARDNVCNFIRWSKEFGVNQSVLFESDDLVLHANTRQVVLCLLDVARIACVKYGFTEAPGLVKFEQEIDRELAAEKAAAVEQQLAQYSTDGYGERRSSNSDKQQQPQQSNNETTANRKLSSLARNSRVGSLADATDDLIMRYCLHKEEEAAKKKAAAELEAKRKAEEEEEEEAARAASLAAATAARLATELSAEATSDEMTPTNQDKLDDLLNESSTNELQLANDMPAYDADSLATTVIEQQHPSTIPLSVESEMMQKDNPNDDSRVDSLDSGEERTESASTSHSHNMPTTATKSCPDKTPLKSSSIPMPIKRSNSNSSLISDQTSSIGTSDLSSSRSFLFSGQDGNAAKRHVASDLDGKVMRIAKSYYGKAATKGVTRLSEGKYKIADRIVFVRLLKGHLVMVRIGGGWDTLENFLFRHKSDPSQVIDVDNLLPLETKMSFEKSPQLTPTTSIKSSKLPFYRRSSSASSTNLSTSNLSVSNHSPTSSSIASSTTTNSAATINSRKHHRDSLDASPSHQPGYNNKQQIPCLLIHRGQNTKLNSPQSAFQPNHHHHQQNGATTPQHHNSKYQKSQLRTPNSGRYTTNRPLGSSRTPTASSTNLYPATLTTRIASTGVKNGIGAAKLNSTTNLHFEGSTIKQEAFRKLGRSNDSLQTSYYKMSPQHNHVQQNGAVTGIHNGNFGARRKIDMQRRPNNGMLRQANGVNA